MKYQTAFIKLIILDLYQLTICNITKKSFKKFSEKLKNVLGKNSNNFY